MPTCTDSRSARERIEEIAEILALGLQRLIARKSSSNSPSQTDSPLDCERVFCRHEVSKFEDSEL
jgi:hypothetical protein